jgi:hypothetical protein
MSLRVLIAAAVTPIALFATSSAAWASDGEGGYGSTHAGVSTTPGGVQVNTGDSGSGSPGPTPPPPSAGRSGSSSGSGPPGVANPNAPVGCTYTVLLPAVQELLGVGGPTPGQWEAPECTGPGVVDPLPAVWVPTAQPVAAATPAPAPVDPAVVGAQAVSELVMPSPTINMAPPSAATQLVNVAAWLWIAPGAWAGLSATATTGPVTAIATAVPVRVVWDMGDGDQVTCDGPGTPYSASAPTATTDCSHTWTQTGSFPVTATVYWQVAWTATGAPGGGNLGVQAGPASQVTVQVSQSQAINTLSGGG